MARKRSNNSSLLEDLMEIGLRVPWQVGILLAIVAYAGFHYLATLSPPSFVAADMKQYGNTVGDGVVRQLAIILGTYLQYIVPGCLLIGVAVSVFQWKR